MSIQYWIGGLPDRGTNASSINFWVYGSPFIYISYSAAPPYVPPPPGKGKGNGNGKGGSKGGGKAKPKNYSVANTDDAADLYRRIHAPLLRKRFTSGLLAGKVGYGDLSFGPLGFSALGADSRISSGGLAFGPLAFSASGAPFVTGLGAMAFGPLAFDASGAASDEGSGAMALGPFAIDASGFDVGVAGAGKLRQFWTF